MHAGSSTSGPAPSSSSPPPSSSPPTGESPTCVDATVLMVKGLDKTWRQDVASVDPYDSSVGFFVSAWLLKYATATDALAQEGCTVPPPGLEALDASVRDLSAALKDGSPSLLAYAIKQVAPELRATVGPGSTRKGQGPTGGDERLLLGEIAHLPNFDVTVTDERDAGGSWGINVSVCYTHPHPGAPDGATRVSSDPWSFRLKHPTGELEIVAVSDLSRSRRWQPAYSDTQLPIGDCHSGWIETFGSGTSPIRLVGAVYAPKDFAYSAAWSFE